MKVTVLPITDATIDVIADIEQVDAVDLTVVASTLTDVTIHGLRFTPDLDACLIPPRPAVAGGAVDELAAYHVDSEWFDMTEATLAAAILRTRLLDLGYTLGNVVTAMSQKYSPDFTLLPLTDSSVETLVVTEVDGHRQAWPARRYTAQEPGPALNLVRNGLDSAKAAPGVLGAIRSAEVVVVAAGPDAEYSTIPALRLPGVLEALRGTRAAVHVAGAEHLPAGFLAELGATHVPEVSPGGLTDILRTSRGRPNSSGTVWG